MTERNERKYRDSFLLKERGRSVRRGAVFFPKVCFVWLNNISGIRQGRRRFVIL
jgi:hypothetical protein